MYLLQNTRGLGIFVSILRSFGKICSSPLLFFFILLVSRNVVNGSNHTTVFTTSPFTASSNTTENPIQCDQHESCSLEIKAEHDLVEDMITTAKALFNKYKTKNLTIDEKGLTELMTDVGLIQIKLPDGHSHAEHHKDEEEHEDHSKKRRDVSEVEEDHHKKNHHDKECVFVEQIEGKFKSNGTSRLELNFDNFLTILPKLMFYRTQSKPCFAESYSEELILEEIGMTRVWLVALASVALISLLSIIGLLTVPLMKFSRFYNRCMAGLVALAVGTLVGDAVLHLIPHATNKEETEADGHEGHNHDYEKIYKHLMVVVGIYLFYLFETLMKVYRNSKDKKLHHHHMSTLEERQTTRLSNNDDPLQPPTIVIDSSGGLLVPEDKPVCNDMALTDDHDDHDHDHHGTDKSTDPLHHCNHSHPPEHLIKDGANTVLDMAWMVIAGDGLHNFSDGLAIGAAFSSSIAAGLSTSFAIFFHELPHELGDFAVLIKAGMSIKQALLYNIMCACLAFVGVIIGLVIGEYTTNFKMWVLALTAGGFLYVALVDMLPGLIKISSDVSDKWLFAIVQLGLISGFCGMLLIALYEDSFQNMFG